MRRIQVIDSHTAGEPTRVVLAGGPDLGSGPVEERLRRFRAEHDEFRSTVVNEPRGSDVLVGAWLGEPFDPTNTAAVIFFNNVGYLGMCGHGLIGVVVTLAYLGRLTTGAHQFETPVGVVCATLEATGEVCIENVPSYRYARDVTVNVESLGLVRGQIAWGGNWFFLVDNYEHTISPSHVETLTDYCWRIRQALRQAGITGAGGAEIDHIELFGPPSDPRADSRNFVLCPGKAYDRSPCGTGTSAKLACLAADGKLPENAIWRQESITGSLFEGWYRWEGSCVRPTIRGAAFVTAESTLLVDPRDPFATGIRR
ncbi:MAG: proline racemase family protein [Bryobacteraceae bacterium]|nr:proline racemase family protein [Bryobacteraceae bacterium]MDW8380355.1 proline racemase family protein [Bryobacterales bacterium]